MEGEVGLGAGGGEREARAGGRGVCGGVLWSCAAVAACAGRIVGAAGQRRG